ncbi:MAG: agmatinase [Candidatus Aenigmatarchaeota archaeon]
MSDLLYPMGLNAPGYVPDPKKCRVWFFGAPFDATVCYLSGSRFGPKVFREAFVQNEVYDIKTNTNLLDIGFFDLGELEVVKESAEATIKRVQEQTAHILKKNKFPVMIGGEHTLTAGCVWACAEKFKDLKVVQIDAHDDMREEFEGSKFDHACAMHLCADKIGNRNILGIGIRASPAANMKFKDNIIFRYQLREDFGAAKKKLENFVKDSNVYITIDMDGFDPGIAPGVGTPEPDGILYHEALELIKVLKNAKKIVGMDIVELRPLPDNNVTEMTASKFFMETMAQLKSKI